MFHGVNYPNLGVSGLKHYGWGRNERRGEIRKKGSEKRKVINFIYKIEEA